MEIQDRLEDKNALSPILVTVEVRHTLAILWSSEHESSHHRHRQQIIKAAAMDSREIGITYLHMHSSPPPSCLYVQHAKGSQHMRINSFYDNQYG